MSRSEAELSALYQDLILDHYRRPRGRGALDRPDARAGVKNPLCGDEIEVHLALDGARIREARFIGHGCSISQASASMMTQLVRGRTLAEVEALSHRLAAMLRGDPAAAGDESLGDLRAFAGVSRIPARVRCAMLPWEALEAGIAGRKR